MGSKFPKPDKIDFPPSQKKEYGFKEISQKRLNEKAIVRYIYLLKSGNILINFLDYKKSEQTVDSRIVIFKIPDLELVEEYVYNKEIDNFIYYFDISFQSKKGNIISIGDSLLIFKGESISGGPEKESETLNDINFKMEEIPFYEEGKRIGKHIYFAAFLTKRELCIAQIQRDRRL